MIVTWRRDAAAGQLAALLDHAQRLGRLGGWEENLVTGTVRWTASAFELFGLVPRPGTEIPLADLHSYVMAADTPVVKRFHQGLAEQQGASYDAPSASSTPMTAASGRSGSSPSRWLTPPA